MRVESRIAGSRWLRAGWLLGSAFAIAAAYSGCGSPSTPSKPVDQFPDGPKISCPATPPTLTSPSGQPIPVLCGTATASGGAPAVSVSCTPSSGSSFPVGSTTVVLRDGCPPAIRCVLVRGDRPVGAPALSHAFPCLWRQHHLGRRSVATAPSQRRDTAVRFGRRSSFQRRRPIPARCRSSCRRGSSGQSIQVANAGLKGEAAGDSATPGRLSSLIAGRAFDVVLLMEELERSGGPRQQRHRAGDSRIASDDSRREEPRAAGVPRDRAADGAGRISRVTLEPGSDVERAHQVAGQRAGRHPRRHRGRLRAEFSAVNIGFDGLHPNAAGYAKMADTFFAALKNGLEVPAAAQLAPARVPSSCGPAAQPAVRHSAVCWGILDRFGLSRRRTLGTTCLTLFVSLGCSGSPDNPTPVDPYPTGPTITCPDAAAAADVQ